MFSALPNRPLTVRETLTLSQDNADLLMFPATPDSLARNDESPEQVFDLLIFTQNLVAGLAYDVENETWSVLAKNDDPTSFENVLDAVVEHCDYQVSDEDRASMTQTIRDAYETFDNSDSEIE